MKTLQTITAYLLIIAAFVAATLLVEVTMKAVVRLLLRITGVPV